ncbi:hypothetical protein HDV06_002205, partial [Boothiomyces sp. JEL0866]
MSLIVLITAVSAGQVCPISNGFCVVTETQGSNTCFTIHSKYSGWNGIGVGSTRMSGADMYIGWANSSNGATVGNYASNGHSQPSVNSVQNQVVVTLLDTRPSWSKQSFSFCRPTIITSNGKSVTASAGYIYAGANSVPSGNVDNVNVNFDEHSFQGSFTPDLSATTSTTNSASTSGSNSNYPQSILTPTDSFSFQTIVVLHGILMFVAW